MLINPVVFLCVRLSELIKSDHKTSSEPYCVTAFFGNAPPPLPKNYELDDMSLCFTELAPS